MSSRSNAFAGIQLTEHVRQSKTGLDQRLFSSAPENEAGKEPRSQEIGKEGKSEVGKEVSQPGTPRTPSGFDLSQRAYRKDSFLFTTAEFEALEDLKLDLRRRFEIKSTKNDLARCALQHLIEDYRSHGETSVAVRRLRTKNAM